MALHKVVCVATLLTLLTPESESQLDACGTAPLNTRIVGGQAAAEGQSRQSQEGSNPNEISRSSHFLHQNLMEVDVPVVGNRQCNCNYGVGTITENMICAGFK
ncbi:hypothetical protein INR49_017946 [Caranx melampygus]|nr:hypothetical protein INR49_017946 [Caranx melampygus]